MSTNLHHEYEPSGLASINQIPTHWYARRLGQIGTFTKGSGGNKDDATDYGLPCIRYGDIYTSYKYHARHARSYIREDRAPDYARLKHGDALFAASGETVDDIGKSVVNLMTEEAYCGPDIILFRPEAEINPSYLGYVLDSPQIAYQKSCMGRGITIMHIYSSSLKYITIPLPPPEEQAAIVRYLDHADELINRYISAKERLIALLEEQRQAVIHQAVTRGLDPDVQTKPGEIPWLENIPKHWDVRRLCQLATKFGSGVTPRGGAAVYRDTGVPFLRSQNVHFDGLRLDDVVRIPPNLHESMSASHVQPHDVLLNITGASIGRVCSVPHDLGQGNVNQHVCIIRPNQELLLSRFLVAFLSTSGAQNDIRTEQTGASREGLTLQSIRDFRTPLPPISEQTQIVHRIDEATHDVYRAIASTSRQIDLANEYRTRLIADFVTGQIDVHGAAIELPV